MFSDDKTSCIKPIQIAVLSVALATPALVQASETSISFKYERSFKEHKYYQPEIGLAHKFDNNVTVNFTQKRLWREGEKESGFPAFKETVVGIAYGLHPTDDKALTLTPKFEYQFKHRQEAIRPSLKLYYKTGNGWGVGGRYRYEYQVYNGINGELSRVSRYDFYLDYNVTDQLKLGWNPSYADMNGSGGGTFYTNNHYRVEHEFKASYKLDPANAVGITYKRKDKTFEGSSYNGNEHDDVVQLAYTHVF